MTGMFLKLWKGSCGRRIYICRCIYSGIYFHWRKGVLAWSSTHADKIAKMSDGLFYDSEKLKQGAIAEDCAASIGFKLGQEMTAADIDRIVSYAETEAKVYAGKNYQEMLTKLRGEPANREFRM